MFSHVHDHDMLLDCERDRVGKKESVLVTDSYSNSIQTKSRIFPGDRGPYLSTSTHRAGKSAPGPRSPGETQGGGVWRARINSPSHAPPPHHTTRLFSAPRATSPPF